MCYTPYWLLQAGDPNFLNEFYGRSRLHHIATWGAEMKEYVKRLQQRPRDFTAREKLAEVKLRFCCLSCWSPQLMLVVQSRNISSCKKTVFDDFVRQVAAQQRAHSSEGAAVDRLPECQGRVFMHIDMDSFFVSVGLRNQPEYIGKWLKLLSFGIHHYCIFSLGAVYRDCWCKRLMCFAWVHDS